MGQSLRSLIALAQEGLVSDHQNKALRDVSLQYEIGVSNHVAQLIKSEGDVISRQYIPSANELNVRADEDTDPIGDQVYTPVKGIVHRYPDRLLLKVTNLCAVYCRYCFRKEMLGAGSDSLSQDDLEHAIDYIKSKEDVWEVILTGGDPFVLSARRLSYIMNALNDIDHVKVIRIHTRIPVADPGKISDTHLIVLNSVSKAVHIVAHINHVKEITDQFRGIILQLRGAGCSVLSQSVLLKGVNDDAKALAHLFKELVQLHVTPYYLHHLDRAKGTSHFRVPLLKGQEIMKELQGSISGICLPRYMLDLPGGHGKVPINETYVTAIGSDLYNVEDYKGCMHTYKEGAA